MSEGLAQGPYMAARVGFKPVALWMQGTELKSKLPCPCIIHACMYTYSHTCMHIHACTHSQMHTHTYIQTYTHTQMHTSMYELLLNMDLWPTIT